MRTITGTDFSINAPDAYTFIFSPNIITVTLGPSYDTAEVVTLSGNGLTFSRAAINRVVKFDMMPVFESKFSETQFSLNYSNGALDPLYAEAFNCVVSAGVYSANVPFVLRWGAIQLDEVFNIYTNNGIKFPFWPGSPLIINSEVSHTSISVLDTAITTTEGKFINIPTNTNAKFIVSVKTDSVETQRTTFIPQTCPIDGSYLRWIDSHGRVWHYKFANNINKKNMFQTSNGGSIKKFPTNYTDAEVGREIITRKDRQRNVQCYATVDNDIFNIVSSVISSPFVHLYKAGRWVRVQIQPTEIAMQDGFMSDIEFTYELPKDYVQRL